MINSNPIYLDYHATTPCDRRVAEVVLHHMTEAFGNASSIDHIFGDEADTAIKQASVQVADLVSALPREVIFTSGATESINLVLRGLPCSGKKRIAVLPVEHKAVLDTCHALEKNELAEMIYLSVDSKGRLDLEHLERSCTGGLSLICVMAANNEIGTIYPIKEVGVIAQKHDIPLLCDGSQAVGKIPIDFTEWGITYLAISGHKLYAPKGVGALIVKKGHYLEPMIYGGGHQQGMRSGTLNVSGIAGLGEACRLRQLEMAEDEMEIAIKRDRLQTLLQESIPDLVINGDLTNRLAGSLHISIPNVPNKTIIARIRHQLAISTGSACSSGVEAPSHVLRVMKLDSSLVAGALRLSLGKFVSSNDVDMAYEILTQAVKATKELLS
ncbi:MAG: cysteine desulfurase [Oscillatoriales cyanobacterium SM2_2_1]|nr:cysteine desulfurase [Oscillatoriales cyanobacterium SM2_2_1]